MRGVSEEFTNEFIEALQNPNQSQGDRRVNRRHREVDVLLIDDIQFLEVKCDVDSFSTPSTPCIRRISVLSSLRCRAEESQGLRGAPDSRFEPIDCRCQAAASETRIAIPRRSPR